MTSDILNISFDSQFSKLQNLSWLPFVGKDYVYSNNKILVVGESHYAPKGEDKAYYLNPNWTREFVLKEGLQLAPWTHLSSKNNLIREIEKTLSACSDNLIWNKLAYYNLIQDLMVNINERPSYRQIIVGINQFVEVARILLPDKVVFCGVEASKHFQHELIRSGYECNVLDVSKEKINGTFPRKFEVVIESKTIICLFIKHPSMAYSASLWKQHVDGM